MSEGAMCPTTETEECPPIGRNSVCSCMSDHLTMSHCAARRSDGGPSDPSTVRRPVSGPRTVHCGRSTASPSRRRVLICGHRRETISLEAGRPHFDRAWAIGSGGGHRWPPATPAAGGLVAQTAGGIFNKRPSWSARYSLRHPPLPMATVGLGPKRLARCSGNEREKSY